MKPLPADAADRTQLLQRVIRDLFGSPPTAEELATFLADRTPTALESLAQRLAKRPGLTAFSGSLTSGPTKFKVLPVDPEAATRPRTATDPGRYTLAPNVELAVSRRPNRERIVNEARINFSSADPAKPASASHILTLPDDYNTWTASWIRGGTMLWVGERGKIVRYDFTNPAEIKVTKLMPAEFGKVPQQILKYLSTVIDDHAADGR